jgi:uncharacterized glyoxalase superfamily protein PhnB
MPVRPIPEGFHTVTPYLIVDDVPRLIGFLVAALGAQEVDRTVASSGRVMHATVRIGDSMVMMGGAMEGFPPMSTTLYVYVEDTDGTYRRAIAAGATSLMEPADQFYGDRNAGVADPSGNRWWFATHVEDVEPAELARRAARERR